ncbi:MAG TPA: cysteine desulfurase family protein [Gemmatimonadales bacterium]|nr:cysteine desulfurase family protein [Gemmatimonadales bacterium]
MTQSPIYLDNAATTPVREEVREAMLPFLGTDAFGNPSSAHRVGRTARAAVEQARRQVATAVGAEPAQVFFTGGGTEADNLAILGTALAARARGAPFRVAVTAIEHKAVLGAAHAVEALGGDAVILPVDAAGRVDLDALDAVLADGIAVVSAMWVNNEVGIVQDVAGLAARCSAAGTPFHTDGVQALGKVPVDLRTLPHTILTISAHKISGPKGVGAIVLENKTLVHPLLHGGGQQSGVRPGTENVPGIVGFGRAAELAVAELDATRRQMAELQDTFERGVLAAVPDAQVNAAAAERAPHISNVAIPGTDSEAMLMHLDLAGICCSAGSACSTGSTAPSHVLTALGIPEQVAKASLRFSFGHQSTAADVDAALAALPPVAAKVRRLGTLLDR